MRRLREHQLVTMDVERPPASIECLVVAINGDEATLRPMDDRQVLLIPTDGKDALLTFEYRSQLVTLRGRGHRDEASGDLTFAVTDRVTVPQRRRYARVDVALTVALEPIPQVDSSTGPTETQTRDLSADGLLVEGLLPVAVPRWRVRLELPDGKPTLAAEAQIVRHVGGGTAFRFCAIDAPERERLKEFVAGHKRAILDELRPL